MLVTACISASGQECHIVAKVHGKHDWQSDHFFVSLAHGLMNEGLRRRAMLLPSCQ